MATLAEYLLGRLQAVGYGPSNVSIVFWDTRTDYGDGGSAWIAVDRDSFIATAQQVLVRDLDDDAKTRVRFVVVDDDGANERVLEWDGTDFSLVPERPAIVNVTPAMLRGE